MPLFLCCWPCTGDLQTGLHLDGNEELRMQMWIQICNGNENGSRSRKCGGVGGRGLGEGSYSRSSAILVDLRRPLLHVAAARLACRSPLASHTPGIRQREFVPLPRTRLYMYMYVHLHSHVIHVCT
jgi:hypothetical protein